MKISFILMFACMLQLSATTYSQSTTIDLNVSNMKVKEVLRLIESKTNFRFFYNDELSELDRTLTLNANSENITTLLGHIFSSSTVSYRILDNNVVVIAPLSNLQQQKITGKVTDFTTGDPLVGVSIMLEGTTVGTTSDVDGKYSLEVPGNNPVLVFSYIGYNSEKVTISGQSVLDITLIPDIQSLDEVVVIGYGTVKKRDLTGSVVSIKSTDITTTPTSNTMEALQGKVAGLDILKTSGAVGSDVDILLRGTRSIYGEKSPLFIIDGIAGSSNQINPSDIESIDILKDASTTAIYGSAGSNGIIIITTKRGKQGKAKVNFDAYYGYSGNAYFKHGMTGDEFINYKREAYRTTHLDVYPGDISEVFTNVEDLQAIQDEKWIDWVDECIGGQVKQERYNLSLTGGTEKTKIFTSFNIAKDKGLLSNENQNRYGLRLNLDQEISKWAKIGTTINLTYTAKNARGSNIFTKALSAFPLGDAYDEDGNINKIFIHNSDVSPLGDQLKDQYANNTKSTYTNGNAYVELTPIKGLSFKSVIGATLSGSRKGLYNGKGSVSNITTQGFVAPAAAIENDYRYSYIWENILTFDKTIFNDHHFTLTGITSWSENVSESNNLAGQGQELDSYLYNNIGADTTFIAGSAYEQTQKMSFAGRFNYSFKGKYLLSVTNRWDGVSWLARDHQWDYFPSAAVAWRVSDEGFMSSTSNWLNNLKFRFGYGVTGNSGGIGAYESQTGVATYQRLTIGGTPATSIAYSGIYANPGLTWEKSYTRNFGIDIGLLKNRIEMAIEFYNTDTEGLLFQLTLPVTSGITSWGSPLKTWQNIGKTNNKGFEISINTKNIVTKDFQWTSSISYSNNKEKIVSLPEGDKYAENLFVGYPVKTFYNYKYAGIWSTAEDSIAKLYGAKPGMVKLATNPVVTDTTNDGGIHFYDAAKDMQKLGSSNPKWILGINNTFTYKGFDLSAFTMIRWGQMIESDILGWYDLKSPNQPAGTDYWTPENQGAYFPRPGLDPATMKGLESLKFLDGSYIKIKNITLGYTFPKPILHKIHLENMRVYFTAYNPIIFTKSKIIKGTDPENEGSDTFPLYKTYVCGINITF